jgi:hypothetical protein
VKMDSRAGAGAFMLLGFVLLCVALGAATSWIAGVTAFAVVCLAIGVLAAGKDLED